MKGTLLQMVVGGMLSGCATGISGLWSSQQPVAVSEVHRSLQCGSDMAEARLTLLDSADAVQQWANRRGLQWAGDDRLTATGRFVMVEMGARPSGGHGLAISTAATLRGAELTLQATFFTPAPDAVVTQAMTQPCVVVQLPEMSVERIRLYDQNGTLRAATDRADGSP